MRFRIEERRRGGRKADDAADLQRRLRELAGLGRDYMAAVLERHFSDLGYQMAQLGWPRLASEREWGRIRSGQRRAMLVDTGTLVRMSEVRGRVAGDIVVWQWLDRAGYGRYHAEGTPRLPRRNPYMMTSAELRALKAFIKERLFGQRR